MIIVSPTQTMALEHRKHSENICWMDKQMNIIPGLQNRDIDFVQSNMAKLIAQITVTPMPIAFENRMTLL